MPGKGESVTDHLLHNYNLSMLGFKDQHQHDIAADSYHLYKTDIEMAAKLKVGQKSWLAVSARKCNLNRSFLCVGNSYFT